MQVSEKQLDMMKHTWGYDHEMAGSNYDRPEYKIVEVL